MLPSTSYFLFADLQEFVTTISDLSHHMADSLLHGFATAHAAQIEPGEGEGRYREVSFSYKFQTLSKWRNVKC